MSPRIEDMGRDELQALVSAHALHALDREDAEMAERLIANRRSGAVPSRRPWRWLRASPSCPPR